MPAALQRLLLSVRSFDADAMMLDAEVLPGDQIDAWLRTSLADHRVQVIHVHTARRGCYLAAVRRAEA